MYFHNTVHAYLSLNIIPLDVCFLHEDSSFFLLNLRLTGLLDLDSEHPVGTIIGTRIKKDNNKCSCILPSLSPPLSLSVSLFFSVCVQRSFLLLFLFLFFFFPALRERRKLSVEPFPLTTCDDIQGRLSEILILKQCMAEQYQPQIRWLKGLTVLLFSADSWEKYADLCMER